VLQRRPNVGLGRSSVVGTNQPPPTHSTIYNLIDRRHGQVSTAVTSNIALSEWGRYLGDATLTAAILNRLAMHAIRINIAGPSFRQHVAKSRAARAPAT
jgi:DNA replication protein DnaC